MVFFGGLELEFGNLANPRRQLQDGNPELFQVNIATGEARPSQRGASQGFSRDWVFDGGGDLAASLTARHRDASWQIRNASGQVLASGQDQQRPARLVALGPAGRNLIYLASAPDTDLRSYFQVPLDGTGEPSPALEGLAVRSHLIDPQNNHLMGIVTLAADPAPFLFDDAQQGLIEGTRQAFAGQRMELMSWSQDFSSLIVRTVGSRDSGTLYLIDAAAGKASAIATERPSIPPASVGLVSLFAYAASDGLEMNGILTLPPGDGEPTDLPVILLPHGGPQAHDEVTFHWLAQAFASRGYAVLQPNFRGSTNTTASFRDAGDGEWGGKMQTDISDGLAALAQQGIVDPERACILGISYGGYAALAGVTLQQGIYRCAVSIAGVSDLDLLYSRERRESGNNNLIRRALLETLGNRSGFDARSPRNHAGQADAPILLMHGRDDTVVFFEQSAAMADALADADKPHLLVELAQTDHSLLLESARLEMLAQAVAFVQQHNPAD